MYDLLRVSRWRMLNRQDWGFPCHKSKQHKIKDDGTVEVDADGEDKHGYFNWQFSYQTNLEYYQTTFKFEGTKGVDIIVKSENGKFTVKTENIKSAVIVVDTFDEVFSAVATILSQVAMVLKIRHDEKDAKIQNDIKRIQEFFGGNYDIETNSTGYALKLKGTTELQSHANIWVNPDNELWISFMPSMQIDARSAAMIDELIKYNALRAKLSED